MKKDFVQRAQRAGFMPFDARPYPVVVIPYDMDSKKQCRWLEKNFTDFSAQSASNNGRCSAVKYDGYNLIMLGVRMSLGNERYSVLAHECYHAVNFVYQWFGARHDADNDEMAAYFLQDIYRQTLGALTDD